MYNTKNFRNSSLFISSVTFLDIVIVPAYLVFKIYKRNKVLGETLKKLEYFAKEFTNPTSNDFIQMHHRHINSAAKAFDYGLFWLLTLQLNANVSTSNHKMD